MDRAHFDFTGVSIFIQIKAGLDVDRNNLFDRGVWMNLANYVHYARNVYTRINQVERASNIVTDKMVTIIAVNNFTDGQYVADDVGRVVLGNTVENVFHSNRIPVIADSLPPAITA
jgi:hypothetical protein